MTKGSLFALVIVTVMVGFTSKVHAHVALSFPPARKYDLDFMDTFRTEKPCGMRKGDIVTTIEAGKPLKITWHLGYPHKGGFKIQLLGPDEKLIQDLTPSGLYAGEDRPTTQEYQIQVDEGVQCQGCSIRLERQALEWGANYRFQSCADVDIVSPANFKLDCSGHGQPSGSSCACEKTYFGERCQYKNDCEDDSDCNDRGDCIDIKGTTLPRKQCFCQFGFFGHNCERKSTFDDNANFTQKPDLYTLVPGRGVDFYYRMIEDGEFEGVIAGKSTTHYVAVGWRGTYVDQSCRAFPDDAITPIDRGFHPMDCTDMVIGTAIGDRSRIGDYYTRDRSTPRLDNFYGGEESLTGALGWEVDGRTYIMFRKPVKAIDDADHDFLGTLSFIWAHGQENAEFYTADELKYHGGNRGHMEIEVSAGTAINISIASTIIGLISVYVLSM